MLITRRSPRTGEENTMDLLAIQEAREIIGNN